jgi:hypothetical protein
LTPNPITRVLSTLRTHDVQALLMGGQACVLYGAAEFSRDLDITLLASPENLARLGNALADLQAEPIAVPPFEREYLERGHAVHFRCHRPDAEGMRLDVMSRMRGVAPFPELWDRRTILTVEDAQEIDVLSLPDLVTAKKTQRDKDWPMIRRLVEANYESFYAEPTPERIRFWLRELRTPELLTEVAARFPQDAGGVLDTRAAVEFARSGRIDDVQRALDAEMERERDADREYWRPLRQELEQLRRERGRERGV